jgi:hypothetical protein
VSDLFSVVHDLILSVDRSLDRLAAGAKTTPDLVGFLDGMSSDHEGEGLSRAGEYSRSLWWRPLA